MDLHSNYSKDVFRKKESIELVGKKYSNCSQILIWIIYLMKLRKELIVVDRRGEKIGIRIGVMKPIRLVYIVIKFRLSQ